ncbi:MAG: RNA methyltransferase [Flavobacteriaceae bacterium]
MVVKNQIKFIKSLQQKKYRNQHGLFVAEGIKLVNELLSGGILPVWAYTTQSDILPGTDLEFQIVSDSVLKRMSGLKSPNKVLAVFEIPTAEPLDFSDWILALDDIKDPGNLGTIIRLCDWFGIRQLLCSTQTVDCYNPKTLQATMGSIARVNLVYKSISEVIKSSPLTSFGAFMDGDSVYDAKIDGPGILVMGNESHGICREIGDLLDRRIGIPRFEDSKIESLNVATATAILLSEVRRTAIRK